MQYNNILLRRYGFGVDLVLQIKAVLPNGKNVRFSPTNWEDDAENHQHQGIWSLQRTPRR